MIHRVWLYIRLRLAEIRAERARRRSYYFAERYSDLMDLRDIIVTRLKAAAPNSQEERL